MALSPELSPSRRFSFTSEPRLFPSSRNDLCLSAAFAMGEFSGVLITQKEARLYKSLRESSPNGEPLKSDQILMAEDVLSGERRDKFKKAFPNIFPLH